MKDLGEVVGFLLFNGVFLEPGWQILQFSVTDRFERAVEPAVYRSEQLYEREQQTGNR